jgi:hypothetical protein
MALGLSASSKNIGRNQGNSYAKLCKVCNYTSPARKVMVEQIRKRNNWKLGRAHKAIHE